MSTNPVCETPHGDVQLGTFEEVLVDPGRYYNDHCLIRAGDTWHFFGIVGNTGPGVPIDPANEISIAHAMSPDLRDWEIHPDILHATGIWPEEDMVFAPNVIEHDETFYMLYAATDARRIQRLCLATSTDLFEWEKYDGNPVIVPSIYWSEWPGFAVHEPDPHRSFGGCRDAHILKLDDGSFAAYWVSRLREDKFGEGMVGVAASVSHDLVHWQEFGPIYARHEFVQPLTLEVESPCVVRKDGRYWLFFKHAWWTWYIAADTPFDFWGKEAKRLGYAHAAEVFEWQGEWWISHCNSDPHDYERCNTAIGRGFFLGKLDWPQGEEPRLL